jgi:gamma-glutamylcyclotransferase (GGCT)/AIG2-like uncharacterized protein YtfP
MTSVLTRAVVDLIETANAARRLRRVAPEAEAQLDSLFRTTERLAVYGSLAPGRQNHHIVAPLAGRWTEGIVEGDLVTYGWGAALGYPALYPRAGGPAVPVHLLTSDALRHAWDQLDAFEGAEYLRVLVTVRARAPTGERTLLTVANLYEAALPLDSPLDFGSAG